MLITSNPCRSGIEWLSRILHSTDLALTTTLSL